MVGYFHALMVVLDVVLLRRLASGDRTWRGRLVDLIVALGAGLLASCLLSWLLGPSRFALLRFLGILVFVHIPVVLVASSVLLARRRLRLQAVLTALAAVVLLGIAIEAYWLAPYRLEVTRIEFHTSKLTRPVRLAVLADLQAERIGDHERGALVAVMEAEPDLILLPGDYLQVSDTRRREEVAETLRQTLIDLDFGAPLGAYALDGDMEFGNWPAVFQGTRVTPILRRTEIDLGELMVTTLTGAQSHQPQLQVAERAGFHVVVGHAPDFALGGVDADLLIAGHTHGGQVQLPGFGPLVTFSRVPRLWASGVTDIGGGRTLVVSRGVGMERGHAPRLRFLCSPEVVIVDLVPRGSRAAV